MRIRIFMLAGALVLITVVGIWVFWSRPEAVQETVSDANVRVLTTFTPLYIFTKNVVGDEAVVENLLPGGVGPHDYSFTPADVAKVARADVLIKQGRGLDDWVDEVVAAAGRKDLAVVVASAGIEPHAGPPAVSINGNIGVPESADLVRPASDDPHTWIDPFLAIREVEIIRDALMARDPERADRYASNAEAYLLRLLALDREIRVVFAGLTNRGFVSFHPAFRYFAYEYGLKEVGVIEEIPGEESTPQDLVRIANTARDFDVKVIFREPQLSPKIVEVLAKDYGLRIAELDPLETGELDAEYYELVTRKNVKAIIDAYRE